jgi:hypothetical protein
MTIDACAQISVFPKLKLQSRARPGNRAGLSVAIKADLNRADELGQGARSPAAIAWLSRLRGQDLLFRDCIFNGRRAGGMHFCFG